MAHHPGLTKRRLEQLYTQKGLSLRETAEALAMPGVSKRVVQRALQAHGIPLRPAKPPRWKASTLSKELLTRLYVEEGRSLPQVAEVVDVSQATVIKRMNELGIKRRVGAYRRRHGDRLPLTPELLESMVARHESVDDIAEELGYTKTQIQAGLRRVGLAYWGRRPDLLQLVGPAELWHLYWNECLSLHEISRRLRSSQGRVRELFEDHEIPLRTPRSRSAPARPRRIGAPNLDVLEEIERLAPTIRAHGIPSRIETVPTTELRRLHHDMGESLNDIAEQFQASPRMVRKRIEAEGIELRHRRGRPGVQLSDDDAQRIAELWNRKDIARVLRRYNVADYAQTGKPVHDLSKSLLEDLYLKCGLTAMDVGLVCGRSSSAITRALRYCGIEVRPPLPRPTKPARFPLTRHTLERLLEQGKSLEVIARSCGFESTQPISIALAAFEIDLDESLFKPPKAVIAHVHKAGVTEEHARVVLNPRHVGLGGNKGMPKWPMQPSKALLKHLYITLGISAVEISERLRLPYDEISTALTSMGILNTARQNTARQRWEFDREVLAHLVDQDWTGTQIAQHFGVNDTTMLRALHRHHLPVQRGGSGIRRIRYDDLIGDKRVKPILERHGVAPASINPADPGPLPSVLIKELLMLGLSSFDVELLTGRRSDLIRRDMTGW